MKLLGIDYGKKKIGLAIGDSDSKIAVPFGIVEYRDEKTAIEKIADIVSKEGIEVIIIGLPLSFDGRETNISGSVRVFEESLRQTTGLDIIFEQEQFTSHEARYREDSTFKMAKNPIEMRGKKIDSHAAAIILENYLMK